MERELFIMKETSKKSIKLILDNLPDDVTLRCLELSWMEIVMNRCKGNRFHAAKSLDISVATIRRYLDSNKIKKPKVLATVGRPKKASVLVPDCVPRKVIRRKKS